MINYLLIGCGCSVILSRRKIIEVCVFQIVKQNIVIPNFVEIIVALALKIARNKRNLYSAKALKQLEFLHLIVALI